MLFADDAAVTDPHPAGVEGTDGPFLSGLRKFGLTISHKKTSVMGQDTMELPATTIDDYELAVVELFTYRGSTLTDNLSFDTEINKKTGMLQHLLTPRHVCGPIPI